MKTRIFSTLMMFTLAIPAWADKAGFYAGIGISSNGLSSSDDNFFDDNLGDERATGFRLEGGYIWDLGKPGGFHLGVVGAYDNFGKFSGGERFDIDYEAQALSALFVIEQEIASWVDFVFKIGPSAVRYDVDTDIGISGSSTQPGVTSAIGFVFFPTEYLGIEIAAQGTSYIEDDRNDDSIYQIPGVNASLQYRF